VGHSDEVFTIENYFSNDLRIPSPRRHQIHSALAENLSPE
jgi:hypothetical protein